VLGHINALIHRPREAPAFVVMVAQSLAADAWHALTTAASAEGYDEVEAIEFSSA
jgi:hypothetical protein